MSFDFDPRVSPYGGRDVANPSFSVPAMERITAEFHRVAAGFDISPEVMATARADAHMHECSRRLSLSMACYIAGEKASQAEAVCIFQAPATAWEHLKLQYAPHWFLKRWPVKYSTEERAVTFIQQAVYPSIKQRLPQAGYVTFFVEAKGADRWQQEQKHYTCPQCSGTGILDRAPIMACGNHHGRHCPFLESKAPEEVTGFWRA